jgi:hypothetical protein
MSPLEQLANQVASHIAQRPVRVYCDGDNDWATLAAKEGFDPNTLDTWVVYWYRSDSRTFAQNSDIAHMSPGICRSLWEYGKAPVKPTKCPTVVRQTSIVKTTIKVPKRVTRRVKVRGKWRVVKKIVLVPKTVIQQVTQRVDGPPAPCYTSAGLAQGTPAGYASYVWALFRLARDSIFMFDWRVGASIDGPWAARANCLGIQWLPWIAAQFGATADDGRSIARFEFDNVSTRWAGEPYWSADCRENGPLDLSPGDGVWP